MPALDAARSAAARVAACVELNDVRLFGVSGDLAFVPDEGSSALSYSFDSGVQVHHDAEDEVVLVLGNYTLTVRSRKHDAAEDDEPDRVATISFQMNALFLLDQAPDDPFDDEELVAFGETTGQFALYPYARELIANLTGRMGLPPLHVGVMRLNLESREG